MIEKYENLTNTTGHDSIPKVKNLLLVALTSSALFIATPVYAGGLNVPQNLKVDQIECGVTGKHNAYATFSWDPVTFATSYRFYSKVADGRDNYRAYDEVHTNTYKMSFNPEFEFYATVSAVNTFTGNPPSVTESDKSKEVFLTAKKLLQLCNQPSPSIDPAHQPSPIVNSTQQVNQAQNSDQSQTKVEDLEKRLNNVENNVAETQKRQSRLEQIVNNIQSFLKRIFAF